MKTIAIANHKGGVGKTAITQNLGAGLAANGCKVLLCDLDLQASLTKACGINDPALSMADVIGDSKPGRAKITDAIINISPNLDIIPADIALSACELGLVQRLGRETVLKNALAEVSKQYDIVLLDCPPALSLMTVNALIAANGVIIPTQPQTPDLRGVTIFLDTIEQIKPLNPNLELLGILVTFYDPRLTHHNEAIAAIIAAKLPLLPVYIGRSIRFPEAMGAGVPLAAFDPNNQAVPSFKKLTEIIIKWLRNPQD
jgi:chromosome partitioning protein